MATSYQTLGDTERALSERLVTHARAADEWEGYRHPHATRIVDIADALAQALYLAAQDRAALRLAALAHDLGMLVMRRDYVKRSGPLTLEEQLDLARHPIIGEQEAARLGTPRAVQLIVRWHHEAWNGMGYPDMLCREQIPFSARILHVADAYASLTDDRPYRPARTEKDALRFISENAGLSFDPLIVQTLLALEDFPALHSHARTAPPPAVLTAGPVFVPDALPARTPEPALPPARTLEPAMSPAYAPESTALNAPTESAEPEKPEVATAPPSIFDLPTSPFVTETAAPPSASRENFWPATPDGAPLALSQPLPPAEPVRLPPPTLAPPVTEKRETFPPPPVPPDEDWWK